MGMRGQREQQASRKVLALYDGSDEAAPAKTRIHQWLETPLNHLGYVVVYHDARASLPAIQDDEQFAGVVSWFSHALVEPDAYVAWAASVARSGKKSIVLGELGAGYWSRNLPLINAVLSSIGLRHAGRYVDLTHGSSVIRNHLGVERFDPVVPPYPVVEAIGPQADVLLELAAPPREGGGRSVVVATGPGGGYAGWGFEVASEPLLGRMKWLLDPFEFLSKALGNAPWPKPDVTTSYGRRIFSSVIDGDLPVLAAEEGRPDSLAKLLNDEIALPFRDLPMTVALAPRLLEAEGGAETFREEISRIWRNPNVDSALAGCLRETPPSLSSAAGDDLKAMARRISWRAPRDGAAPDAHDRNMASELEKLSGLAGPREAARLFLWPRDSIPSQERLAEARQLGLFNIGGADERVDFPSLADIPALTTPVGQERLLQLGASGGCAPFREGQGGADAVQRLRIALANGERPRRVRAFNLDYQLSLLRDVEGSRAVKALLQEARSAPLFPLRTSDYAAMVSDFDDVALTRIEARAWAVTRRGAIQTFRFDQPGLDLDLARSKGVLGRKEEAGTLYVSLDAAEPAPIIWLADQQPKVSVVGLSESRWRVVDLKRGDCGWDYVASGFGPGEFVWYGVKAEALDITAKRNAEIKWRGRAHPDLEGHVSFVVKADGSEPLTIEARCVETSAEAKQ